MKIVQLVNGKDTGGAMTHILALLKGFDASVEIILVTLNDGAVAVQTRALGLEVHSLDGQLHTQYFEFVKLVKQIGGFDVLHTHGSRANLIGGIYGKLHSVPVVASVHSDYHLDYDETVLRRLVFKPMSQLALKLTPFQISISHSIKKLLGTRGFKPENVYAVYNGLDFSNYVPDQTPEVFITNKQIPNFEDAYYIGITTRFHSVKGLDVFIEAASRICAVNGKVVFLISGSGDEGLREVYQKSIETTGFSDRIKLVGYVKPISNVLQFLKINVLTSHSETFPYALLEGGYFGVPAISSNVGGVSELIEHEKTGLLFEDGNVEQLVQLILRCLSDDEYRISLGQSLQKHVMENYSHEIMAIAHLEIYNQIIERWKK